MKVQVDALGSARASAYRTITSPVRFALIESKGLARATWSSLKISFLNQETWALRPGSPRCLDVHFSCQAWNIGSRFQCRPNSKMRQCIRSRPTGGRLRPPESVFTTRAGNCQNRALIFHAGSHSLGLMLVVASGEPAELQRSVPPVAGRYSGLRFRRSNDTPTLHPKYQGPIRPR
jgi:hypothetical protein